MTSGDSGFDKRKTKADTLIDIVQRNIWDHFPFLQIVEFGYETHIPEDTRQHLQIVYNETARYIRYAPDFFVLDQRDPRKVYLLEYKCSQMPIYSNNRIRLIERAAQKKDLSSERIGIWESDAFDNYYALHKIGVRVAILSYVAYHKRPLLCDFVENVRELYRAKVRTSTIHGSRTPGVNFDAYSMATLQDFLMREHAIPGEELEQLIARAERELLEKLPIEHHTESPYR